jgi:hypothetical protein
MVVTTIFFAHTTFLWATCCLICFIPIVKPFLTHWSWLRIVPFIERGNTAHGGCDRSTGDAYSSMAPDPTFGVSRGLCKPDFYCGMFHYLNWTPILTADFFPFTQLGVLILTANCSVYLIWTLILTTDFYVWYGAHGGCDRSAGDAYSSMAPVPTSDIFRGPCTPILWFVFPIRLMRLIFVISYTDTS